MTIQRAAPLSARVALLSAAMAIVACGGGGGGVTDPPVVPPPPSPPPVAVPLRTIVANRNLHVAVGTAVGSYFGRTDAAGVQYATVLKREFNVLTPENEMKFNSIRPSRNVFRYTRPDSMVDFAAANGMRVRGHTLIWGNQSSAWLTGGTWSADTARALLDEHITGVVNHYKGKLAAWDVVNEALDENGTLRTTVNGAPHIWATTIGGSYIEQAFRTAAAVDPAVPLYYNDYNIETANAKSDALYTMMQDFKARGVPITGVGFQGHFDIAFPPTYAQLATNFARFAALGLKIQITELDVRMTLPATSASLTTQAQVYRDVFRACLDTPSCDMVVMWGFTDASSWIPGTFAGKGAALLFDESFQPKAAYTSVNDLLGSS